MVLAERAVGAAVAADAAILAVTSVKWGLPVAVATTAVVAVAVYARWVGLQRAVHRPWPVVEVPKEEPSALPDMLDTPKVLNTAAGVAVGTAAAAAVGCVGGPCAGVARPDVELAAAFPAVRPGLAVTGAVVFPCSTVGAGRRSWPVPST